MTYRPASFPIVGLTFVPGYPENVYRLEAIVSAQFLKSDRFEPLPVVLKRNPANEHDPNAVEVHVPAIDSMVGHVPRHVAARLARVLDEGVRFRAELSDVRLHPEHPENPGLTVTVYRIEEEAQVA